MQQLWLAPRSAVVFDRRMEVVGAQEASVLLVVLNDARQGEADR
jgi:predicted DsbA family dithiol-disulfide isomerase